MESLMLFVTGEGMVKLVEGTEFAAQKKTIMATKLSEGDKLAAVSVLPLSADPGQSGGGAKKRYLIRQSEAGYFLRFDLAEVSLKKKNAIGIRGMNLGKEDHVKEIYVTGIAEDEPDHVVYKDKDLYFSRIRLMSRNTKGVKIRR